MNDKQLKYYNYLRKCAEELHFKIPQSFEDFDLSESECFEVIQKINKENYEHLVQVWEPEKKYKENKE